MPGKFHTELDMRDIHLVPPSPVSLELPSAPAHLSKAMQRWSREPLGPFSSVSAHIKIGILHDTLQSREHLTGDEILAHARDRIGLKAMVLRRGRMSGQHRSGGDD